MRKRKVFNIGFHRTGTSSLTQFMRELDFKVLHSVRYSMQQLGLGSQDTIAENGCSPVNLDKLIDENLFIELVQQFDFFSDNPWPLLYRRLNRTFPDSLFILTRRNVENWMNSLVQHAGDRHTRMRQIIYGFANPRLHVSTYKEIYLAHNKAVETYFCEKKNFMSIDLEEDNSVIAHSLMEFLGVDNRTPEFPLLNKSND